MDRKNKPSTIPISPSVPQPIVDVSDQTVAASLPSHDSVTINLFGATVTSWVINDPTTDSRSEQLFLSDTAKLDGSKAIRGGIPIVFPIFGPPPKDREAVRLLPQHGFARSALWEFLGKNSSESASGKKGADDEVKLDFGLSSAMLLNESRQKWPFDFGLVYTVTLGKGYLETGLQVRNTSEGQTFEFQALFHNYFRVQDIATTSVHGLQGKPFYNKVTSERQTEESASKEDDSGITISSATDIVYSSLRPSEAVTISQQATTSQTQSQPPTQQLQPEQQQQKANQQQKSTLRITRESLPDCTLWNPWQQGAESMSDFEPKDGYQKMICVEPGAVESWIRLEGGEVWEGRQMIRVE